MLGTDKAVYRVAIAVNARLTHGPMFVFQVMRFLVGLGSAPDRFFEGLVSVFHFHRNVHHSVAMPAQMFVVGLTAVQWRSQHQSRITLS